MPTPFGYPQPRASQFIADAELITAPYGADGVFSGDSGAIAPEKRIYVNAYYDGSVYRAIQGGYSAMFIFSINAMAFYTSGASLRAGTAISWVRRDISVRSVYADGSLTETAPLQAKIMRIAASDAARKTQAGPWTNSLAGYVEVATCTIPLGYGAAGTVRVKYDLRRESVTVLAVNGQIKVNGVVVSGPTAINSQTYVTTTVDIDVSPGDVVSLEIADPNSVTANAANFILAANDSISFITKDAAWS